MLTVLVATRNGARTLAPVLEAYCALEPPSGGWKLVIVDNGSTDASGEVITSFEDRLPITYVFEPKDSKNAALNTGLAFVSGDLVVFSDDDTFPSPDWLVRLREAADSRPAFGIFGGVILPRWETNPPSWILNWVPLAPAYAISDSSLTEGPVDGGHVFGPNLAIRTEIFDAGHRFDPSIGPTSSRSYTMGSETEFILRVQRLGVKAWHVHAATVDHFVRTTQMQRAWIFGRAVRFGRGQCRVAQNPTCSGPRWFGVPRGPLCELAGALGSILQALLSFDQKKLFRCRWRLNYLCGYLTEARALNRKRAAAARGARSLPII